jgi:hypothetical protein
MVWVHDGPVCVEVIEATPVHDAGVCRCPACHGTDVDLAALFLPEKN